MWTMSYLKDIKNDLDAVGQIAKPKKDQAEFIRKLNDAAYNHSLGIQLSVALKSHN